jgi:hypothetical protein
MANEFTERMRSVGYISRRSRPTVRSGRAHPESGLPYKATTDEHGTVTEHGAAGSGVSSRQDALVTPPTHRVKLSEVAG